MAHSSSTGSNNVVGIHYRVGKKIGEGSFGVIFEGTNLLNSQTVAIKFVSFYHSIHKGILRETWFTIRNLANPTRPS